MSQELTMSRAAEVLLVFRLGAIFAAFIAWREQRRTIQDSYASVSGVATERSTNGLPRLVNLGRGSTEVCLAQWKQLGVVAPQSAL
jgi:hypothetical protein